jgi:hypothetical protein
MFACVCVYVEVIVPVSDAQFRASVAGAAVLLVAGITVVRFCGSVSLPPKPDEPVVRRNAAQLADQVNASPALYQEYLAKDAAEAGVRTPTYDQMKQKLLYRVDEGRRVLEVGDAPVSMAGLELSAHQSGDAIVLEIRNTTKADLGYRVETEPTPKFASCTNVEPLQFNALVIGEGQREVRVECTWREGIAIAVTRVESIELGALSAWYVGQVPPLQLGIEQRIARGHRKPKMTGRCIGLASQAVRSGIENGEIGWRDLVDFYARHRCQTYPFPLTYRAFTADGQRSIPAI